jgi:hypothetical protein
MIAAGALGLGATGFWLLGAMERKGKRDTRRLQRQQTPK